MREETSVETQEVADPVISEENQEVADPETTDGANETTEETDGRTEAEKEADAVFAQRRRELEEREAKIAELEAEREREEALAEIRRTAEELELDEEETEQFVQSEAERLDLEKEKAELEQRAEAAEAELQAVSDIAELKQLNPELEVDDLTEGFYELRAAGASAKMAYYAMVAEQNDKPTPPKPIDDIEEAGGKKTFFTKEEVLNMTDEQLEKNLDVINQSSRKW